MWESRFRVREYALDEFWTKTGTYAWSGKVEHAKGVDDLWNDYIVPRRRHLFETHSIHNTAKGIGYPA